MENIRVQIDLPVDRVREIDELMKLSGIGTRKLYIEYSLAVMKWALAQSRDNRAVVSFNETTNSYKELSMPPLDNIRQSIIGRVGTTTPAAFSVAGSSLMSPFNRASNYLPKGEVRNDVYASSFTRQDTVLGNAGHM